LNTKQQARIAEPNWWQQPLAQLKPEQWEQLCDGCGKCCLHKLENEDTGEVFLTAVACQFLDQDRVRCGCYQSRSAKNPDCLVITPENINQLAPWLPKTCAYRLRHEDQPLPGWHPLCSGVSTSVEKAGQSVRYRCLSEREVDADQDWQELILPDLI